MVEYERITIMTTVYINLHPEYDYSTAIIDGYLDLREYVQNVEWLSWDKTKKGPWQIRIHGTLADRELAKTQHMVRAAVFSQRMIENGCVVKARLHRGDRWQYFKKTEFTKEKLFAIECERDQEPDTVIWARKDIEKYTNLLNVAKEKNMTDKISWLEEELENIRETIQKYEKEETFRIAILKELWK